MLAALAGAAVLAVIGVLSPAHDLSWRFIGACVAATVASCALLAACKFLESEKTRYTALAAMIVIIGEFVLALTAMTIGYGRSSEERGLLVVLFPVCAVPGVGFFHAAQRPGGRYAGVAGIAIIAAALLFFGLADLASFASGSEPLWGFGWGLWFLAILVSASLAGIGINRHHWRWIGVGAALVAFALAMYEALWAWNSKPGQAFLIATTVAIVVAHANVIMLFNLRREHRWLRWLTIAAAMFSVLLINVLGLKDLDDLSMGRVALAAGMCAACGTVAVAILAAFNRKMPNVQRVTELKEVSIACPMCGKKQTIATGQSRCAECGLQIAIELTTPRCPKCDYSLLMLKSDRCPECGESLGKRETLTAAALTPLPEAGGSL